ncbi:lysophospholipid acyltransferase family protein [Amaricoccus solimangrovi]|uniref:Acyltransferase n=1 Tax=Amaricoccus solimangrovi TaxID=2589815 RepID=A0A501WZ39_9RHOB|nr:acyltransferase [Amaricoccus solimangrovi]TPE52947.1 acyltransferase [Amaricoccus solimangrovi]
MAKAKSRTASWLAYLPQAALLGLFRALPAGPRGALASRVGRFAVNRVPRLRNRVENNLRLIFPEKDAAWRAGVRQEVGDNFGRTIIETMTIRDFQRRAPWTEPEGPGWQVMLDTLATGKGVFLVSGHFGQWEAVRGLLLSRGMETGGIFRPIKNPFLNADYTACLEAGGRPMVDRDAAGLREMIRHVRKGGMMSILMDQYTKRGAEIDFLGHPAPSGTMIAELAVKYDLPMIPAYATRRADGSIRIEFEAPLARGTALEMTQAAADSLAARVRATPGQWFWLHRRWVKEFPGENAGA